MKNLKIFTGNCHRPLAEEICKYLSIPLEPAKVKQFPDREVQVEIGTSVRGDDVFIIQPTPAPAENWFELFLMVDALVRSSAGRITAVLTYCGYTCQDRKDKPHVPISIDVMATIMSAIGVKRVILFEIHNETTIGFFHPCLVDHLYSTPVLIPVCQELEINEKDWVIVSSDLGRAERTRGFARRLSPNFPVASIDKRREDNGRVKVMNIVGDIKGKNLLLFDDMIRTAATLIEDIEALKEKGAKKIISCVTHLNLTPGAVERIIASDIELVVATNSLPFSPPIGHEKRFRIVSVASLIAQAIQRVHENKSVTELYVQIPS
ncbi:MAG: ribose-phosphate diphosphokinase [Patescibacteria group bacterium]